MKLLSNLRAKKWRINTSTYKGEESLSLAPLNVDVLFTEEPIPDFTKIQKMFLEGTKANDNNIRNMGIVISHDAIVFRRKYKEENKVG